MKTIYLKDANYNWTTFNYDKLDDIIEEFKKRNISIGDGASIGYEEKLITGLYINGTKDAVTYVGNNKLSIGCHTLKISNWKKKYKEIGEDENYSQKEIEEYYGYILLAEKFTKTL